MKRVCDVLGVARSAAVKRQLRSSDWTDGRQRRHSDDQDLVEQLRSAIENLPSYGYRRAWALLRRERAERVNDFATPSVMNLLCRAVDCGWGVSPEVAG